MNNRTLGLVCLLILCMVPLNIHSTDAQEPVLVERGRNYEIWDNLDGTFVWESAPYWVLNSSSGQYVPYVYAEYDRFYQVQTGLIAARIYKSGYAEFYDPDLSEIRVYEETWQAEYYKSQSDKWVICNTYDPSYSVTQNELFINITASFLTDYPNNGQRAFNVTYVFRAGKPLKHEVTFVSYADSEFAFRVIQKWKGIVASKVRHSKGENDIKGLTELTGPWYQFQKDNGSLSVFENQEIMFEYLDPVAIDIHPQGMKCDFIFANWSLRNGEYLTVDPDTMTYSMSAALSGYISHSDAYYPPTTESKNLGSSRLVGQVKSSGIYYVYRAFVSIDTSAIPDYATISSATFKITMGSDHSDVDFDVKLYSGKDQWTDSSSLSWSDCDTYEGVISNTGGWVGEKSKSVFTASVNKTGTTQFRLISSREGTAPGSTQDEYVSLDSGKLTVTYSGVGDRVDIAAGADTFVSNAYPNTNYGSGVVLYIDKSIPNPGIQVERTWLKFDLSSLGAGWSVNDIHNATLCLWTQSEASGQPIILLCYSSEDSWTETGLTWSNQPLYDDQMYNVSIPQTSGVNIPYYWNTTDIVRTVFSGDKILSLALNTTEPGMSAWHARETTQYAPLIIINGPYAPSASATARGYIEVHAYFNSMEVTADGYIVEYADSFETPYVRDVKPGVYTVQVTYNGQMQEYVVVVSPSETEVVNAYFEGPIPPGKAHIRVHAFLDGAEFAADALIVETSQAFKTPALVEVDPGSYTVKVTYGTVQKSFPVTVAEGETATVNAYFTSGEIPEEPEEPEGGVTFNLDFRPIVVRLFGGTLEMAGWGIALGGLMLTTFCGLLADRSGKHGFAIIFLLYFEGLIWVIAGYIPWIVYLVFAFLGIWAVADKIPDWLGRS